MRRRFSQLLSRSFGAVKKRRESKNLSRTNIVRLFQRFIGGNTQSAKCHSAASFIQLTHAWNRILCVFTTIGRLHSTLLAWIC